MPTAYLIRHAAHDLLGAVLVGRTPGVRLSASGHAQAEALAKWSARARIETVLTSPLERCVETAEAIARGAGAPLESMEALNEIDFGDWRGRSFDELRGDPAWTAWNARRGSARCPSGESMLEAQARIARRLERLPGDRVAVVTHGDLVKAALCWALGLSLDALSRFEIEPASVSAVELGDGGPRVLWVNRAC